MTLSGIEFDSGRPPERSRKAIGHREINLSGQDNLLTGIDLGRGTRMFRSGGGLALGRHSGA